MDCSEKFDVPWAARECMWQVKREGYARGATVVNNTVRSGEVLKGRCSFLCDYETLYFWRLGRALPAWAGRQLLARSSVTIAPAEGPARP